MAALDLYAKGTLCKAARRPERCFAFRRSLWRSEWVVQRMEFECTVLTGPDED